MKNVTTLDLEPGTRVRVPAAPTILREIDTELERWAAGVGLLP